jgi:hypothetical protein
MGDIQFTPLTPPPAPVARDPAWLRAVLEWLNTWLGPLGRWLALHWGMVEVAVIAMALVAVAWVIGSLWRSRERLTRTIDQADGAPWQPDAAMATALLADADQLAAAGRFDEAVHLLLRRSFDDIAGTRPDWLTPASTAREIALLTALPTAARTAFAVIAGEVERSRYALNPLGHPDWARARAAYATFAVPGTRQAA